MAKVHVVYFDINTGAYFDFNHGLAYIIGSLVQAKHQVFLSHLKNEDDFQKALSASHTLEPDAVCLSFATNQKKYVHRFFNLARSPSNFIIAGGVHCTLAKEQVFKEFPKIQGICIGEGELAVRELCRRLDFHENYVSTPSFYFNVGDTVVRNRIFPLQDIDTLPLPDYSLFDYREIIRSAGDCFSMLLSRGCPHTCSYCCNHALRQVYQDNERYVRFPRPHYAIRIIKNNLSLYPQTKKISFSDDTFTLDKKWLKEFCELYKQEIKLPFFCNSRIDTIDEDISRHLKSAGCRSVAFGVESGSDWLRSRVLGKNYSNETVRRAFAIVRKQGMNTFSFNMFGLPFETKAMAVDTICLNRQLQPNFGKCFYFFPYPKTELHELCLHYGLLLDDLDSRSGYFESPSLKGIFMSHRETKGMYLTLELFFYTRVFFSRLGIPSALEKVLSRVIFLLVRPALGVLYNADTAKQRLEKIRLGVVRIIFKYSR